MQFCYGESVTNFRTVLSCILSGGLLPSVLWRCWLGGRKGIRPVKTEWWGAGMVISSKIQIGFTFLVPAHLGSPRQRAVKWVCYQVGCVLTRSRLEALALYLSRPSGRLWLYAGFIGSNNPCWLKADLVVCLWVSVLSSCSLWAWVGECFFWYRLTRLIPDKRPLHGCVCVCLVGWLHACLCAFVMLSFMHSVHSCRCLYSVVQNPCSWLPRVKKVLL